MCEVPAVKPEQILGNGHGEPVDTSWMNHSARLSMLVACSSEMIVVALRGISSNDCADALAGLQAITEQMQLRLREYYNGKERPN
jgi:hypothetical protein